MTHAARADCDPRHRPQTQHRVDTTTIASRPSGPLEGLCVLWWTNRQFPRRSTITRNIQGGILSGMEQRELPEFEPLVALPRLSGCLDDLSRVPRASGRGPVPPISAERKIDGPPGLDLPLRSPNRRRIDRFQFRRAALPIALTPASPRARSRLSTLLQCEVT